VGDDIAAGFGTRLRAARDRIGLSQAQVAARCGLSRSALAEAELGGEPLLGTALRIARVVASLDAETTLAGLLLGAEAPASPRARVWPAPIEVTFGFGGDRTNRRELLKLAGVLMLTGTTESVDLDRVAWVTANPQHIDAKLTSVLRNLTSTIVRQRWEVATPALISTIRAHLAYMKALLPVSSGAPGHTELVRVTGETAVWTGRLAEYVDSALAREQFAYAHGLGQSFELPDIISMAMLGQAHSMTLPASQAAPEDRLRHLDRVAEYHDALPATLRAWLMLEQSEAYAAARLGPECTDSIDRAEELVATFTDEDRHGYFFDWNIEKMAIQRGCTLIDLGELERSIQVMSDTVPTMEGYPGMQLSLRSDIAEAMRRLGERSAALDLAHDVYQVAQRAGYAHTIVWATRVFTRAGERPY